ncbi:hypothetical protein ACNKHS_07725 [Shigella flexneri]
MTSCRVQDAGGAVLTALVDIDALAVVIFASGAWVNRINGFKGFIFRRSSIFTVNK